ncbi:MAG: hypothetical protein ACKVT0_15105, partial [Planctomycetaceae bacterium]
WNREAIVPEQTVVSAKQQSLLEFSPTLVRGRSHVRYQIQTGLLQDVRWNLPEGVIVRHVTTDRPSSHEIVVSETGIRQLLVEFDDRPSDEVRVNVEWWLPVEMQDKSRIEIPPLNWFAQSPDAQSLIEVEEVHVGVSSVPGYEIASAVTPQDVLRQMTPDDFLSEWNNSNESRRPTFVAVYKPEIPIACVLKPHQSVKKVRQDELLHLTRQRAAWSAAIEVETTQAPALSHELILDPRVQLESVTVKQDDADRLSHFFRDGDRLTLILKDLTSGTQYIAMQGSWPLEIDQKQNLPRFACQADEIARSTIVIRHDEAMKIELSPGESWKEYPTELDVVPADAAWKSLGRFVRQPEGQDYQVSLHGPGSPRISSLAAFKLKSGNTWTVRAVYHVDRLHALQTPLIVEIPDGFANSQMQPSPVWEVREEPNARRKRIYSCTLVKPESESDVIVVEGEWNMPGDGPWTVPLPIVADAEIEQQSLLISPRDQFKPEAANERQIPEDIPVWGRSDAEEFTAKTSRLFVKGPGEWTLTPAVVRGQHAPLTVNWLRSECRINRTEGWLGRTLICVESAPGLVLRIDWPESSRLDAVWLNGSTLPVGVSQQGEVSIPLGSLNSTGSLHVVQLYWQHPVDASWKAIWNSSLRLPQIREAETAQHFVEIIGSGRQRRLSLSGIAPLDDFEFHLELAESYAKRIQQVNEAHLGVDALRSDLTRELHFLASNLPQLEQASGTKLLLARWNQLKSSVVDHSAMESDTTWISSERTHAEALSDRLGRNQIVLGVWPPEPLPAAGSAPPGAPVIQMWWIDSRWYTGITAAISLCALWYILRRIFAWTSRRKLALHASWFALGVSLIWWLCLRASFVGFCLSLVSLWKLWQQWRRYRLAAATSGSSIAR